MLNKSYLNSVSNVTHGCNDNDLYIPQAFTKCKTIKFTYKSALILNTTQKSITLNDYCELNSNLKLPTRT